MKVAVVGSRSITDNFTVENTIRGSPWSQDASPPNWDIEFISGGADGVDTSAERFADSYDLPITVIEPDYDDWSSGHPAKVRNTEIIERADAVIAIWDGNSNGTRDSIEKALDRGVPLYVSIEE